ncbi:MAG: endolytic transglycosylase MltG, partial [Actinomycetota bacterium]|nr:endolytic transglycosylase MltG [Actinomycetota bacterium]
PRGVPKRHRGARRVIPLLFLAGVAAVTFFLYRLYEPGADAGEGRVAVAVTVAPGSSAEQIGRLLAEQDVVASSFFFSLRARMSGDNLRAGKLDFKRGMSYEAALAELTKAPPPAPVVTKITLPEGPGRKELAARVRQAGFTGSYVKASRRSGALDPRDFGAPQTASLEGFLFPATYELKPRSSARALVGEQTRTFKREFDKVDMATATRRKLSRYDVLIVASMIEREALVPKDRRLIAGVIYNRLKQGMPLGIDATIRFELENFSRPLRESELKRDTPYNTRTRTGLPPGPIGNPGLAAIRAAANPASNDFVYYVVKPCENGAHAFSSSNEKFLRDVAAYNAKRDELGGKDPSQC